MPAPKGNQYALGNSGGRPTKLTEELLDLARGYLFECNDKYEQVVKQVNKGTGNETIENKLIVCFPSVAGLARTMGISRDTIYEWCKPNKEISDSLTEQEKEEQEKVNNLCDELSQIVKDIQTEQEKRLLDNGLAGTYNPMITKLILGKHGYSEKTETDLTSKGEKIEAINYIVPNGN